MSANINLGYYYATKSGSNLNGTDVS